MAPRPAPALGAKRIAAPADPVLVG